jgi:hypothetical protein
MVWLRPHPSHSNIFERRVPSSLLPSSSSIVSVHCRLSPLPHQAKATGSFLIYSSQSIVSVHCHHRKAASWHFLLPVASLKKKSEFKLYHEKARESVVHANLNLFLYEEKRRIKKVHESEDCKNYANQVTIKLRELASWENLKWL